MVRTAIRYERPVSKCGLWAGRFGLFAALLLGFSVLGHRLGMLQTSNFVAFCLLSAGLALLALVFGLVGLVRLWTVGAAGGRAAFRGILFALIPLIPFAVAAEHYLTRPALINVSTDPMMPPQFPERLPTVERWSFVPAPESAAAARRAQSDAYPGLIGRRYEGAIDRVSAGVAAVLAAGDMTIVATDGGELRLPEETQPAQDDAETTDEAPAETFAEIVNPPIPVPAPRELSTTTSPGTPARMLIQAEAESPLLSVRTDIVVRLVEGPETTSVDMRATTRLPGHDLGLSAWTIERFLAALDAELLGIARN